MHKAGYYIKTLFIILIMANLSGISLADNHINNDQPTLENAVTALTGQSFDDKAAAVELLSGFDDERILPIFQVMLKNKLYYIKENKTVVFIEKTEQGYTTTNVLSGQAAGIFKKSRLKKISVNNSLRRKLRAEIAQRSIRSTKDEIRLAAVDELVNKPDGESVTLLRELLNKEKNDDIIELAKVGIAIYDLNSDDENTRLKSIVILSDSLLPAAKTSLVRLLENESETKAIKSRAKQALANINSRIENYEVLKTITEGLSAGSILILIAVGLAITFGVMGVINMAHGELMMLGAYTTYVVQTLMPDYTATSIFVAIPLAFIVSGAVGILIERLIVRNLHGRPLDTLLATFGVGLILQQAVRSLFGPTNMPVTSPEFMSGSLVINPILSITYNRLFIIVFAILIFIGLVLILKKTRLGLQVRAVAADRDMAKAMGVHTERVDMLTFGLGSGIAGMAGVALSQITNVGPNLGQSYIVESFMVVVFGGVGNITGTFVSGSILGMVGKFLENWYGAVVASILVLIFIILFIQKWPRGLFPQKGRAAES